MNNPNEIMNPGFTQLLEDQRAEIFANFNCINIGKIESVNKTEQTVEIQLQIKRLAADGTSTAFPVLVDCPYFVLQGGGAYIDMPIAAGDICLVLFNDRCIDNWWNSGNVMDPPKTRKHSLSDGIALVGINAKPNALNHDGTKTRVINPNGIELNGNGDYLVLFNKLKADLTEWATTVLAAHTHPGVQTGSGSTGAAAGITAPDIDDAATSTIITGD